MFNIKPVEDDLTSSEIAVNTVYKTTDHKMFTRLDGNRDLNKAHLKASMLYGTAALNWTLNLQYR